MQSRIIRSAATLTEVMAEAINQIRATTSAVYQGNNKFLGNFSEFVFSDNPANALAKWLFVQGSANAYSKCKLENDGATIEVPNLRGNYVVGQAYTITEADPFLFDGYVKEINMKEAAQPSIWIPRPQNESIAFGDATSVQEDVDLLLVFSDFSKSQQWRDTLGLKYGDTERPFTTYIEKPLNVFVRKLINKLDNFVFTSTGGNKVTVTFRDRKNIGSSMFIRRFGEQQGLTDLGFNADLSGFSVELRLRFHNIGCLNF